MSCSMSIVSHVVPMLSSFQNTQCALGGSGSFSAELLVGSVMRVGCDGEPGSGIRLDVCGECGGREECVDCGGEVNGSKSISNMFNYLMQS